jgi:hypothetical protein
MALLRRMMMYGEVREAAVPVEQWPLVGGPVVTVFLLLS